MCSMCIGVRWHVPQLFLGLNARCFRALELTQAAWRRDRLAKTEENKVESSREDFVCYTLVIEIYSIIIEDIY